MTTTRETGNNNSVELLEGLGDLKADTIPSGSSVLIFSTDGKLELRNPPGLTQDQVTQTQELAVCLYVLLADDSPQSGTLVRHILAHSKAIMESYQGDINDDVPQSSD